MFGFSWAPRGWALCEGQLLPISSNDALFSLIGTIYGGDGRTTFGLPDMRGRLPMHHGRGPGLSERGIGAKFGTDSVTLTVNEMPSHTHIVNASTENTTNSPNGAIFGPSAGATQYLPNGTYGGIMNRDTVARDGGNRSHTNMMPSLTINFSIALYGVYPSRH
jgi:microcystin-dependent protein